MSILKFPESIVNKLSGQHLSRRITLRMSIGILTMLLLQLSLAGCWDTFKTIMSPDYLYEMEEETRSGRDKNGHLLYITRTRYRDGSFRWTSSNYNTHEFSYIDVAADGTVLRQKGPDPRVLQRDMYELGKVEKYATKYDEKYHIQQFEYDMGDKYFRPKGEEIQPSGPIPTPTLPPPTTRRPPIVRPPMPHID